MIYYLLKKDHDETLPFKQSYWWLVAGGLLYGVIPALPNSISAMYQGNVNSENFTSLVVTLFLYFSIMFSIGLILWQVLSHCKSQTATILIIGAICIFALPIQQMNARISMVHFSNSQRLLTIEQLFQTDVAQSLNHHVVYSPDLFETKNALFISSNYWETVAMHNNISLKTIKEFADESFSIYEDDCEFTILGGNDIVILSKKHITGANPVRISSDDYMLYDFQFEEQDGSFYRYNLSKVEDPNGKITLERSTIGSFSNLQRTAGNTLQTANILVGVYNDGWVAPDAQIQISTGSDGKVVLTGTYIKELTGNENISIYVDGVFVKEYTIENPEFSIELDSLPANKSITLHLISDFKFPATPPDLRELSFIISNLEGE